MKSTCLALLMLTGTVCGLRAEPYRTDINPALLYYLSFIVGAEMPQADHDYLLTNEWRGQKLPARFGELVGRYDRQFDFVRQAAHATVPCDWGIDWSAGPNTLLPQLARVKAAAQMARLRGMWDLQNGRTNDACDDLLAAFTMGRNGSRDNSLIAVLVQIAAENIIASTVAENFGRFSPETLNALADGFEAAPARGTVANSIATTEMHAFTDWAETRVLELRRQYPDNDAKVLDSFRDVFEDSGDAGQKDTTVWPGIVKAAGGTSDGFLKLVREMKPMYGRVARDCSAARTGSLQNQIKLFYAGRSSPSPQPDLPSIYFRHWRKPGHEGICRSSRNSPWCARRWEYKLHGEEQGLGSASWIHSGTARLNFIASFLKAWIAGLNSSRPMPGVGFPK